MAISITTLLGAFSGSNSTDYVFNVPTPPANSLLVAFVNHAVFTDPSPLSMSIYSYDGATDLSIITETQPDWGQSSTQIARVYAAHVGASPSASSLTVSTATQLQTDCHVLVIAVTGVDLSSGTASAISQSEITWNDANAGAIDLRLDNTPVGPCVASVQIENTGSSSNSITVSPSGWTWMTDVHDSDVTDPIIINGNYLLWAQTGSTTSATTVDWSAFANERPVGMLLELVDEPVASSSAGLLLLSQ